MILKKVFYGHSYLSLISWYDFIGTFLVEYVQSYPKELYPRWKTIVINLPPRWPGQPKGRVPKFFDPQRKKTGSNGWDVRSILPRTTGLERYTKMLPPRNEPIGEREQETGKPKRACIVHRSTGDRKHDGEGKPNNDVKSIGDGKHVDRDTPTAKSEGPIAGVTTFKLADEEQGDGNDIADVEWERGKGNDGVEGSRGADVDQGQQTTKDRHKTQSVDGDF